MLIIFCFFCFFFFKDTATTEIYTLSLHDALPICPPEHRFRHDDRQPIEPDAEDVSLGDCGREAVRDDEQIGKNHAGGHSPSANPTRQEPLSEVNHAADPENLARNEHQEQGQEEQLKRNKLTL